MEMENLTKMNSTFNKISEKFQNNEEVPGELIKEFVDLATSFSGHEEVLEKFNEIFDIQESVDDDDNEDEARGSRVGLVGGAISGLVAAYSFWKNDITVKTRTNVQLKVEVSAAYTLTASSNTQEQQTENLQIDKMEKK